MEIKVSNRLSDFYKGCSSGIHREINHLYVLIEDMEFETVIQEIPRYMAYLATITLL